MAIVIPSKHIYNKSFDPVVDNNITQIEVKGKKYNIITDYRTIVSNEDRNAQNIAKSQIVTDTDCRFPQVSGDNYYIAALYGSFQIGYLANVTIEIPKEKDNERITYVYDKKTIDGYNNIGYTVNYTAKSYNISANATLKIKQSDKSVSIQSLTLGNRSSEIDTNASGIISDDNPVEYKETATFVYSYPKQLTLETICSIPNESTIPTASIIDNGDSYNVTLKILTYKNQYYLSYGSSYNNADYEHDQILPVTMSGKGVEFIPNTVDITIYGDVIKLDIMEIVEKIGNGNNVFSFDGNELIQTTNTPSIETRYQGVANKWKNGKQTAVITCPIADYYDNDKIAISIAQLQFKCTNKVVIVGRGTYYEFEQKSVIKFKIDDIIEFDNGASITITNVNNDGIIAGQLNKNSPGLSVGNIYIVTNRKIPMIFQKDDIVIPYTYTNKGDKPLSYNKDFTPKQFKVIGTKISKRQGGMQELTLQEV